MFYVKSVTKKDDIIFECMGGHKLSFFPNLDPHI